MIEDDINDEINFDEIVEIPIDGVLDLHTYAPQEVKDLVPTYLDECLELGITEVQIIHGKGKGVLAHTIRIFLENHPDVVEFQTDTGPSGWGATIVQLRRKSFDQVR